MDCVGLLVSRCPVPETFYGLLPGEDIIDQLAASLEHRMSEPVESSAQWSRFARIAADGLADREFLSRKVLTDLRLVC